METGDAAGPVKGRERRLSIPGVANIATQVALAQKVTGMWANITEVARKRELEDALSKHAAICLVQLFSDVEAFEGRCKP